jgi:hypothetical protein
MTMLRRYRSLRNAVALPLFALSCGDDPKQKGQLMVAIQTDMSIPKDVTDIRVKVLNTSNGLPIIDVPYTIYPAKGGAGAKLPATVAIVAGEDPSQSITIQVIAERNGRPRTLREAVSQVPTDRIAVLHMPIQWLCSDQVDTSTGKPLSECDPGSTCISGECKPNRIEVTRLETFDEARIFGGGSSAGDGQCFQTLECLDDPAALTIQPVMHNGDCTVTWPSNDPKLNLGLLLPPGGDGICNDERCYVPLDGRTPNGWTVDENAPVDDPGNEQMDGGTGVGGAGGSGTFGAAGVSAGGLGGGGGLGATGGIAGTGGGADGGPDDFAQSRTQQASEGGRPIRIKLPPVICRKLRPNGSEPASVLALKASTGCATVKSERTPTCGPWSVVGVPRSSTACDHACDKLTLAGATCAGETDEAAKDPLACRRSCRAMPATAPAPCGPAWQSYIDCVGKATYTCGESGITAEPNCEDLARAAVQSCGDAGAGEGGSGGAAGSGAGEADSGIGGMAGVAGATSGFGGAAGSGAAGTGSGGRTPDASGGAGGASTGLDCAKPSSACETCVCGPACTGEASACSSDPGCGALFNCARQNRCPRVIECAPCQSLASMYPEQVNAAGLLLDCARMDCPACADGG